MGQRHKHADVIIAWANGEEIQYRVGPLDEWDDVDAPSWVNDFEYRIKPKIVKREGWVNVYACNSGTVWPSKERADRASNQSRKACIRIEWEEEV